MMKKRELILDFTSLLDVIMILLFVVIHNMNQASLSANEETERILAESRSQVEALSDEKDNLLEQVEDILGREVSYEDIGLELKSMKQNYDALENEYAYLKIISDRDADDMSIFKATIERMAKITLICTTEKNEETDNYEVRVDIYLGTDQNDAQSLIDSVTIEHDLNLTRDERMRFNAEQVTKVTKVLENTLKDVDLKWLWFSIQYPYEDENFSNLDLEILNRSISDLERVLSKSCYIDKIKL